MDERALSVKAAILRGVVNSREDVTKGMDVKELARITFEESRGQNGGWLLSNDEDRFRVGCATIYTLASEEDQERIEREMRMLNALGAAMQGVPVDFSSFGDNLEESDLIGLMRIYRSTAGDKPE